MTGTNTKALKREIIELIDNNPSPWIKAAFYSDPVVNAILDSLYKKWDENNRRGEPLDYASYDDLRVLHDKAIEYSRMSEDRARLLALRRLDRGAEAEAEERGLLSRITESFKRIYYKFKRSK